ncbi:hypothetical protein V6Z11_D05G390800 [Gossypium hirsutum]
MLKEPAQPPQQELPISNSSSTWFFWFDSSALAAAFSANFFFLSIAYFAFAISSSLFNSFSFAASTSFGFSSRFLIQPSRLNSRLSRDGKFFFS